MYPKRIPKHLIFDPQPKRKSKAWVWWLVMIVMLSIVAVFSLKARADSEPALAAGHMRLTAISGERLRAVHLETEVVASITGLVVTTEYIQHFRNDSDHWAEGVYVFPLPETAAIQHMSMQVGERRIVGEIRERKTAETIYQQAKSAGKRAALTLQQRDNLFTQKVANIAPHQHIEVRLTFIDTVRYQDGTFEWRLPTTLTPRFIPGISKSVSNEASALAQEVNTNRFGWAMATDEVPDAHLITPQMVFPPAGELQNPLHLSVTLNSGMEIASVDGLYHDIKVSKEAQNYRIGFTDGLVEMDRDVVLRWQPVASAQPRAAVFQQQIDNETFAMVMMLPPDTAPESLPKDILFVIDVSGSMQGQSILQAKSSLAMAIEQLSPQDRFNIIAFNNNYQLFNNRLIQATSDLKHIASQWVSSLQADGGTHMYPALEAAYRQMFDTERLQQVVFITDGAISNEEALFGLINQSGGNTRLFTVGIGSAPNSFFMTRAAQLGRGSYEFVGATEEVYSRMARLFKKLNHVAATNIDIAWPDNAEPYPAKPADLFHGEALLAFAKLDAPLQNLTVTGETSQQMWQSVINAGNKATTKGIASLWARYKIADIEDRGRNGELDKVVVRDKVLNLSLTHSLLTRFTAFIAIEDIPTRPIKIPFLSEGVANVVPHGSGQYAIKFANTATSATLTLWLGFAGCALLLALKLTGKSKA